MVNYYVNVAILGGNMKKHKLKNKKVEQLNKKHFNKVLKRKKKFDDKVNRVAEEFISKDKNLTLSQAKQKAIQLLTM